MGFTVNKALEQPARGSDVGVWDTPVNNNSGIIDNSFGGTATVAVAASPVTLSPSQYQCVFINFTGTLLANVAVTFPFVGSFYTIENNTTGNFVVTLQTTVAGSQVIGVPQGRPMDVKTDGNTGNVKFRNLPPIGSYMDYASATFPIWISACTVPPALYCNGSAFSSATFPYLATILGTTTLPDHRGRARFAYNDGTGRLTQINGNVLYTGGGADTSAISQVHIPNYNLTVTDPGHFHQSANSGGGNTTYAGPGAQTPLVVGGTGITTTTDTKTTGISVNSGGSGFAFSTVSPGVIGGIALMWAG